MRKTVNLKPHNFALFMWSPPFVSVCLIAAALLFVSGCFGAGKPPDEKPVPASGKVTVDGKPMGGVRLMFTPMGSTKGVGGSWAVTNDDGTFKVTHWSNKEGLPEGTYAVSFSKFAKPDGSPLPANEHPRMSGAKETIASVWNDPTKVNPQRQATIPAQGTSSLEFKITSAKK